MMLSDVRDFVESLKLADYVYMSRMPDKKEKSFGVYNSKHQNEYHTALGGVSCEGYGEKYVSILVHWNKSPRNSEKSATALFEAIRAVRNVKINEETINFIQPLYDLQDIGTDEAGIYEYVIEVAVNYQKGK